MYIKMIIPRGVKRGTGRIGRTNYWRVIAENLDKAGWSCAYVATVDYEGQRIWTVDAHREDGNRHIVRAYELATAFKELERAVQQS
jgi:spore coat polysaccharide biosynthesis predicted glycosyltransferase SpsG